MEFAAGGNITAKADDNISMKIKYFVERITDGRERGVYYYNLPITELLGGSRALVNGREMGMYASYSYLGLIGHPRINEAAKAAIDRYGTGTHGVRSLAGTLEIHGELEQTIADFKHAEAAITYSSGYVTNLTVVSTLVGRHDVVICDKYNHASIIDGCLLSGAPLKRFKHNDMEHLERLLQQYASRPAKLVVVDSVFSMDGDIVNFPKLVALCQKYDAWLMVDEAHSIGVLGETGRGIEEHFGMGDVVDIKMGTLSKTIPSVGGYIAGKAGMIEMLRHASRSYIFSAALPPAQTAAANEAFKVILDEPERITKVNENSVQFINGLKAMGYDTMLTETAIVPVLCGEDEKAFELVVACHKRDLFVLPVVSPAVPADLARLRATVTAAHTTEEIDEALNILETAGKEVGLL